MLLEPATGLRGERALAAQQQDRHVVIAATDVDLLAQPVGQQLQTLWAGAHQRGEQLHPVVEVGTRFLDESVGVEDQGLSGVQLHGADRVFEPVEFRREPQRQPAPTDSRRVMPLLSLISGSTWPARTSCITPVDRSASAYVHVANRSVSSSWRKTEARAMTVAGVCPSAAYARSTIRSCPITAAACVSCPCTSPMTSWTVLAWARAAVVVSTTLVCRRRSPSISRWAVESASSSVASRTMPMMRSGRPVSSRRTEPWVWVQRRLPSRRRMRKYVP
jgi:hypothetical protein